MEQKFVVLTTQSGRLQANPLQKFNKKVDIVANPSTFDKDQAKFAEWWIKLQIWGCYTSGFWPSWDNLKAKVEKYFKPQTERDWAHQQICSFRQGHIRTDNFVTRFLALLIQRSLGNEHTVELLEQNMAPAIAQQLYIQGRREDNLSEAAEAVQDIGKAQELH
ncbi:hypothetical protein SERLA73DRAFT_71595 [Serpula lacrymans var. lacrymans S7.3]|uniref:Retrotransposon gag domain-containing protein n=2 Tax=Serpula lacrymans var. lacrymans TaxID=341189 RepID=F8PRF9_SERL3|nr:uncharacterized protein SERLADRAFT_435983 [Serpula lacrymans var. lacrymans S7.9]EGO00582.1 hypothetical protein SERLA73DRAFT_71595 [Serpula lacrymans var. lacrymans S7.3]EGO26140.1 hypothetical protein SERLADRAFT_435983 [Serpula lacrymans var. lacrymans S7.9]